MSPDVLSMVTLIKKISFSSTYSPKIIFPQFIIDAWDILFGSFLLSGSIPINSVPFIVNFLYNASLNSWC